MTFDHKTDDAELSHIIALIEDWIYDGDWEALDAELAALPRDLDSMSMIAWLRYSYRASGNLPSWSAAVIRCADAMREQGLTVEAIMTGLLPPVARPPILAGMEFMDTVMQHSMEISEELKHEP